MSETSRRARMALLAASLLALAFGSCWLPAFDPAVSLSVEMDAFFEEYGDIAWRREYALSIDKGDEWLGKLEFKPSRDGNPGGFFVLRTGDYFRIVQIQASAKDWEFGWRYDDASSLGERAFIEPLGNPPSRFALLTDPERGLRHIDALSAMPVNYSGSTGLPPSPSRRLLSIGSMGDQLTNNPQVHYLLIDALSGAIESIRGVFPATDAVSFTSNTSIGAFTPGVVQTGFSMAVSTFPVYASLNTDGPELWSWTAVANPAARVGSLKAPVSGAFHSAAFQAEIGLLAQGPLYTDIYDGSGAQQGALPTGAWRFAYEWYDSGNTRWLMVFSRVLRIEDGDKSLRLIVNVEAVPTEALLEFAKD